MKQESAVTVTSHGRVPSRPCDSIRTCHDTIACCAYISHGHKGGQGPGGQGPGGVADMDIDPHARMGQRLIAANATPNGASNVLTPMAVPSKHTRRGLTISLSAYVSVGFLALP